MTEEKKLKRTLSNTPATEWGPMDDNKAINALLTVFKKLPESRRQAVVEAFFVYAIGPKPSLAGVTAQPEAWGK